MSVASGWRSPQSPRPVDAPALQNPANIRGWLTGMSNADKVGLIDRLDTQALLGEQVLVLQISGDWAHVAVPGQPSPLDPRGYPVWIPIRQLTALPPPHSDVSVTVTTPTAWLSFAGTRLEVSFGTTLPLLGRQGASDIVGLPGGATATVSGTSVAPAPLTGGANAILATARSFLGLPYLWGGTSGFGFDCTGLIHVIFKAHGVTVPRDSDPQSRFGVAVSRAGLQPGDLVFFSSQGTAYHAAVYAGSGMVIDSPSPGYAVEEVPMNSMPNIADFSGARRVIPEPA
ncbi:MAG TPA: NlpC/P60 family protein [Candidatus Dormibacteraeota bacterium]|nr:NlpC/P60 family protein [Candidatus Dormibacteraeota bacterium]